MAKGIEKLEEIAGVIDDAYSAYPLSYFSEVGEFSRYQHGVHTGMEIAFKAQDSGEELNIEELTTGATRLALDQEVWKDPHFLLGALAGSLTVHKLLRKPQ